MKGNNYYSKKIELVLSEVLKSKTVKPNFEYVDSKVAQNIVATYYDTNNNIEKHLVNTFNHHFNKITKPDSDGLIMSFAFIKGLTISTINALNADSALFTSSPLDILEKVIRIIGSNVDKPFSYDNIRLMKKSESIRLITLLEEYFKSRSAHESITVGNCIIPGLTLGPEIIDFYKCIYIKAITKTFAKEINSMDFILNLMINIVKCYETELLERSILEKYKYIVNKTKIQERPLFEKTVIKINPNIEKYEELSYTFNVLCIPFNDFGGRINDASTGIKVYNYTPNHLSVCFGFDVDFNTIYQITYILKEIYCDFYIYINYATLPEDSRNRIVIGSYLDIKRDYTNISDVLCPHNILEMDINNHNMSDISSYFPNNNYCESEVCRDIFYDDKYLNSHIDNDNNDSYEKYGGYNGWSDNAIDDAFEGDPMNTWNVD